VIVGSSAINKNEVDYRNGEPVGVELSRGENVISSGKFGDSRLKLGENSEPVEIFYRK
jgi:hypothetical protein